MRSLFFICFVFASSVVFAESLTLTTYYPAPSGAYKSMRAHNMCVGTNCVNGTAADNNLVVQGNLGIGTTNPQAKLEVNGGIKLGTDAVCTAGKVGTIAYSSNASQVQVCQDMGDGTYSFVPMGQGAADIWIGGGVMSGPLDETYADIAGWFTPPRSFTNGYYVDNWNLKSGSVAALELNQPYFFRMPMSATQEPLAGEYKIVYGGGTITFFTGKRFVVKLYVWNNASNWQIIDTYSIENDVASSDNLPFSYSTDGGVVEIPVRTVYLPYYYQSWTFGTQVAVVPVVDVLNWTTEIGPQHVTLADWTVSGPPKTELPCLPNMRVDLCGKRVDGVVANYTWTDYYWSNVRLQTADMRASGVIEGMELDIYRSQ